MSLTSTRTLMILSVSSAAIAAMIVACSGGTNTTTPGDGPGDGTPEASSIAPAPSQGSSSGYGIPNQCYASCIAMNCDAFPCEDRGCWEDECRARCQGAQAGSLACKGGAPTKPCNDVVQEGTQVKYLTTKEPVAAPTGGAITDGTYVLTAAKLHTSGNAEGTDIGMDHTMTLVFENGTFRQVDKGTSPDVSTESGTWSASGVEITMTLTCEFPPRGAPPPKRVSNYTATPTRVILYGLFAGAGTDATEIVYDRVIDSDH